MIEVRTDTRASSWNSHSMAETDGRFEGNILFQSLICLKVSLIWGWMLHVCGMLCRTWWSAVLLLLCARMPCAPVVEYEPPCLIKPCCVVPVWLIQFRETQQWIIMNDEVGYRSDWRAKYPLREYQARVCGTVVQVFIFLKPSHRVASLVGFDGRFFSLPIRIH